MRFCPDCGSSLPSPNPKFCPQCGARLQTDALVEDKTSITEALTGHKTENLPLEPDEQDIELIRPKAHDLGKSLEEMTAEIFQKRGWSVKRNFYPPTKTGARTEIDVFLERGKIRKAVECKNFDESRMVGVKDIRDFTSKLEDIGIAVGIAVTNTQFSEDAMKFAESKGIELWDGEKLREAFFACALGRVVNPSLVRDPTLPIEMDYETASRFQFQLKNPQAVNIISSILFYHPYISVKFRLQISRKDPTGRVHKTSNEGTYFVDALDADIINREKGTLEQLGGLIRPKQERLESKEDKMISEDLEVITSETKPVLRTSDYEVTVAEQEISTEEAIKIIKYHVVEKNTHDEKYTVRVKGEEEKRTMRIVPKLNEVEIRGSHTTYVPKWVIEYESGPRGYTRRFLAASSKVISDELAKCSQCTLLKKETISVCEECGRTLCEKHSYNENGRFLCYDHISNELKSHLKDSSLVSKLSFWKK